jgi:hypothetical protein
MCSVWILLKAIQGLWGSEMAFALSPFPTLVFPALVHSRADALIGFYVLSQMFFPFAPFAPRLFFYSVFFKFQW